MIDSETLGSIVSNVVAGGALLVSIWSLHKTNKFNARQNELADTTERLNRLLIDREAAEGLASKKADLSANLYQASKNNYRLKVFNRGKGTARNIRFADLTTGDDTILMRSDIDRKFPMPILEQHQSVELIAAMHMASPPRTHIKLIWDDDTGQDHEKELTPSL